MIKKLNIVFRNSRGFTLFEIVISMGIFSIILYAVMSLTRELTNTEKRSANQLSKSQFVNALGHYLYSPVGCQDLIGKKFTTTYATFALTQWTQLGATPITTGTVFKDFTVTELKGQIDLSPTLPRFTVAGESLKKTLLSIKAEVEVGLTKYPLYYNLSVLAKDDGVVVRCGDDKTDVEICAVVKGVYNPATGLCNIASTCNLKGTIMNLTCTPSTWGCDTTTYGPDRPNNYTGTFNCPVGAVKTQTGTINFSHVASCGAKCTTTVSDTATWFSCIECPP
jgi:prepilin-type N-terminal cleavage/methylation domain-containing protein